jgi:Na+(H+)/acetate symporter ActP
LQVISESTSWLRCRGRRTCFGLAAASLFPAIILDFDKKMNKEGAIAGMIIGYIDAYAEIQIWTLMVEKMLLLVRKLVVRDFA